MPDSRFFDFAGPKSLSEIADISGASLADSADPLYQITGVASLSEAGAGELAFLDNIKYKEQFQQTEAGACFAHPDFISDAPEGVNLLLSPSPYKAYALAAQALYPDQGGDVEVISERAIIHESVRYGAGCVIEAGVVLHEGVELGDHVFIEANVVIGRNVKIGSNVRIGANSTVSHALIGDHSRLYPGVRVGQDGFGFAIDPAGHVKVPQLGRVIIEEHVEIGSNTCIDRGAGPDTVIGQGTWIDNLVQIGHNVKIGRGCIIVSQTGISGSTVVEDFAALGGQSGVAGHLRIGKGARVAAQSGIMRDIPAGQDVMGSPALPMREYMKQVAFLKRLGKKK